MGIIENMETKFLNSIPSANVKASPSVNSQNDGIFNSEENMKWANSKLAQKPFIVGKNSEDTDKRFSILLDRGTSIDISSGMFSSDGYLFKIGEQGSLSYDDDTVDYSISLDTDEINNFVFGLTGQGTSTAIESELNSFVFSEFAVDPEDMESVQENWKNAYDWNSYVGYIKLTYTGDFYNELSIVGNNLVRGKRHVPILEPTTSNVETPDAIKSYLITVHQQDENIPVDTDFAVIESDPSTISIYYAIRVKSKYVQNNGGSTFYVGNYFIYFTDIFSIFFSYDACPIQSRTYPNTESVFTDMTNNIPLQAYTMSDCIYNTIPKNFYDPDSLYRQRGTANPNKWQKYTKRMDLTDYQQAVLPVQSGHDPLADIMDKYTAAQLVGTFQYIETNFSDVYVENTLSYYCIKDIEDTDKITYTYNGVDIHVPVAFMTSDGRLCPDGFICGENNNRSESRIFAEGYLHYVKRKYMEKIEVPDPTEEDIKNVTIEQLIQSQSFLPAYTIIFKYISMYMQLCYSSLVDNVMYTDKTKFNGCGNQLLTVDPNLDNDESNTYLDYSITTITKEGTVISTGTKSDIVLTYHKDTSSDYDRCEERASSYDSYTLIDGTTSGSVDEYVYELHPNDTLDGKDIRLIDTDDPINYIRSCRLSEYQYYWIDEKEDYDKYAQRTLNITDPADYLRFYKFGYENNAFTLVQCTTQITSDILVSQDPETYVTGPTGRIDKVVLDDYLMPVHIKKYTSYICIDLGDGSIINYQPLKNCGVSMLSKYQYSESIKQETDSLINGLAFAWNQYQWRAEIPLTISLNYDYLDYLRGADLENPDEYKGISFSYKIPDDIVDTDLVVFNLVMSASPTNTNFDNESCSTFTNIIFEDGKVNREAYIHISKIFGDNGESLRSMLENKILAISDELVSRIQRLELTIYGPHGDDGLVSRVEQNESDIATLIPQVAENKENIQIINTNVTALGGRLTLAETDIADLKVKVERNKNDIDALFDIVAQLVILAGTCGANVQYEVVKTTEREDNPEDPTHSIITSEVNAYLHGSGETFDYGYQGAVYWLIGPPFSPLCAETRINSIIIDNGITKIGSSLFYNCSNISEIKTINMNNRVVSGFPSSVKKIGSSAFVNCGFTELTIPDTIGDDPSYWAYVEDPTLPEVLPPIGEGVFNSNNDLETVNYNGQMISDYMFGYCPSLETFNMGTSVKMFGLRMFEGNYHLTTINYAGTAIQWNNIIKGTTRDVDMWYQVWLTGELVDYGTKKTIVCSDYIIKLYAFPATLITYLNPDPYDPTQNADPNYIMVESKTDKPQPSSEYDGWICIVTGPSQGAGTSHEYGQWYVCSYDTDENIWTWGEAHAGSTSGPSGLLYTTQTPIS